MQIEIRDPALEARIQEQLKSSGSNNVEDVLRRLLETQDRWLLENKLVIQAKIDIGLEQLDAGQGIHQGQVEDYIAKLGAKLG